MYRNWSISQSEREQNTNPEMTNRREAHHAHGPGNPRGLGAWCEPVVPSVFAASKWRDKCDRLQITSPVRESKDSSGFFSSLFGKNGC